MSRRFAVVLLGIVVATLTGCGAGKNAATQDERAVNLPTVHAGALTVAAARLVPAASAPEYIAPQNGTSATPTSAPPKGPLGYLVMVVVNSGHSSDSLTNVNLGAGSVRPIGTSAAGGAIQIAPSSSMQFGDPDLGGGGPALEVSGLPTPLALGTSVHVTLTFTTAGPVSLDVPVVAAAAVGTSSTGGPIATTGSYPTPTSSETGQP